MEGVVEQYAGQTEGAMLFALVIIGVAFVVAAIEWATGVDQEQRKKEERGAKEDRRKER